MAQFQATNLQKDDMQKLLCSINKCLGEKALSDNQLDESFVMWWPKLEDEIQKISHINDDEQPERSERELLKEILNTVRNISRQNDMYDSTSKILATLSPREEKILRMYFGIGEKNKSTIDEIAKDFDEMPETIKEIQERALKKLRHPSRAKVANDLFAHNFDENT